MTTQALRVSTIRSPGEEQAPTRHLEVAPSHAQRRARPRLVYAIIVVGGIGAVLLAQLLLSIATADGAYRISALQVQQRDYSRQQSAIQEQLDVLRSTQNLTRNAEALGMIASGNPVFLDASTGQITGTASAAGGTLTGGGNLIANALLSGAGQAVQDPSTPEGGGISTQGTSPAPASGSGPTGAPAPAASSPPVPSAPGVLPSPTTR